MSGCWATWKSLRRRYLVDGSWSEQGGETLFKPEAVTVTRYRYRGTKIPTPWDEWLTKEAA